MEKQAKFASRLYACMSGCSADLYRQHIKAKSCKCASSRRGWAEGIVLSQGRSVSGCKLLQLDSTPTRFLHNHMHSSLCSAQSTHMLIVLWLSPAMAEWRGGRALCRIAFLNKIMCSKWLPYSLPALSFSSTIDSFPWNQSPGKSYQVKRKSSHRVGGAPYCLNSMGTLVT